MAGQRFTPLQIGLLTITAILLVATIIGLSIFIGTPNKRRSSTRKTTTPNIPLTSENEYAFDVADNLKVCGLRTSLVPLDGRANYSEILNTTIYDLNSKGGGTLALDEGEYILAEPWYVPGNVCIRGKGMDKTILKMAPQAAPFFRAGMIRIKDAERVSLIDFTADGANDTQRFDTELDYYGRYGLYATSFKYLWIRGVRMRNHYAYGFDPHGTRATWSNYLVIEGSVAEKNGLDGFTLDQTKHISLLDSVARDNYRHGVNIVTGSSDVVVRRLTSQNNGEDPGRRNVGCGITVQNNDPALQTKDCILDSNTIMEATRAGVCVSDSINVTISNTKTTIMRTDSPCYLLRTSSKVAIVNSTCLNKSGQRLNEDGESQFTDDAVAAAALPRVNEQISDPACTDGVQNKHVCCPKECGECGGEGCSKKRGFMCCMDAIAETRVSCNSAGPPCIVSAVMMNPTPHVHISTSPTPSWTPAAAYMIDIDAEDSASTGGNKSRGKKTRGKKKPVAVPEISENPFATAVPVPVK